MSESEDVISAFADHISDISLRLQAIEEAPLGITIADMRRDDQPLVYVNDGFVRLTGYERDEILGRNCRFLQGAETAEKPVSRMREAIEAEESVQVELRNYRKDGSEFWAEVTLAPLHTESGTVTHYVGFQQDVSERKAYEQQIETQRDDLTTLNEMVRHDIRNDLQVALASMELLQLNAEGTDQEQITAAIESIQQAIGLTNVAREVADVMLDDAEKQPTSLRSVLQSEIADMRASAPDATVTLDGTIPAVEVPGDKLLGSVFRNLFTNAIRHNESETPQIRVAAGVQDRTATVTIADNGPGVPAERRARLFEKGWTSNEDGSGMGLYLVRRLLENYGGSIHLAGADDAVAAELNLGGAIFVVKLPVVE